MLTVGGFLSFFIFGFIDNLKGPLLPAVLRDENMVQGGMSYRQGGTVFLSAYIGFVVATMLTGILADLLSNRRVMQLAGLTLCAGILGLNLSSLYPVLLCSMFVIGLGLGAIELGANGLMVELHHDSRARYLNLLATFHGIGSMIVPIAAAILLKWHLRWQQIYLCTLALAGLLVAVFAVADNSVKPNDCAPTKPNWDWAAVLRVGFTAQMCWFYLLIGTYVATELGLAAWIVEYLQHDHKMGVASSSFCLSGFFVLIMLGRLAGSVAVEQLGYFRMIAVGLVGTLLCLAIGIFGPMPCVLFLPLSGLFMSIVFPTVTAAVSDQHATNIGSVLGILFTFGGMGGALGPWIIGIVSDAYGLQLGLACTLGFCSLALASLAAVTRFSSPQTEQPAAD